MFRNFYKLSFRIIIKQKLYSLINIAGLALGMAVFILIMMMVINEYSVDKFYKNFKRIYRFETAKYTVTSGFQADFLKANFPQVELVARVSEDDLGDVKADGKVHHLGKVYVADSSFTRIFDLNFIYGNGQNALCPNEAIILSQSTALRLFGNRNPVGLTIGLHHESPFVVSGVYKDFPGNSSFDANGIIPLHHARWRDNFTDKGKYQGDYNYLTYVLLYEHADTTGISTRFKEMMKAEFPEESLFFDFSLVPLGDIYFDNDNFFDIVKHGNKAFVHIYLAIAIFILLIACINFINLTTSRTAQRAKEVGIKRVVGATRRVLIAQFLAESVFLSLLALVVATGIADILAQGFGNLIDRTLEFTYTFEFFAFCLGGAVTVGLLAGIYPALFMSAYEPSRVIKREFIRGERGSQMRKILIFLQFIISVILIIASIVINKQLNYIKHFNPGFRKDQVIFFQVNPQLKNSIESFKKELLQNPVILGVSRCNAVPGQFTMYWGRDINKINRQFSVYATDPDFVSLLELEVVEGRNFSYDMKTDENAAVLFNQKAVKEFELDSAIGTSFVTIPGLGKAKVIGIVKDFNFKSLHSAVEPLAIAYLPEWSQNQIMVKLDKNKTEEGISWIKEKFLQFSPDFIFDFQFLDKSFDALYKKEQNLSKIFVYFSGLAIIIALLGLFGLVSYTAERYTREIGIRKTFGATESGIVVMLTGQFLKWILLANVFAYPVAWYFLDEWLKQFAYTTPIPFGAFVFATAATLIIALLTILYQSVKVARANPVETLRYE